MALNVLLVAPPIGLPSRYHWLPVPLFDVSVTLPPVQNVSPVPALIDGVVTTLIGTVVEFVALQLDAFVTVSVSVTAPDVPAVYVTFCDDCPAVIVPFVIDQLYDAMPAGPLAVLPVELTQTGDDAGVIAG